MECVRPVRSLAMELAQLEHSACAKGKKRIGVILVTNTQEKEEVLDCEICSY